MKKIDDWFFAGLVAGIIGGACLNLYCLVLLILGVKYGTYWQAMGGLFYNKQLLASWLAQIHGVIDSLGVSGANGIITCLTIKQTGTKYFYTKSIVLSAVGAYFLFLGVYPQTGLGKDNPITPWVALSGHTVFLGLLTGYILKKIYFRDNPPIAGIKQKSPEKTAPDNGIILPPERLKKSKTKKVRLMKPKKL